MATKYHEITTIMGKMAQKKQARILQKFFKTAPGEYGAGDIFMGIKVPQLRLLAQRHLDLPLATIKQLLLSCRHEERLLGLIILTNQFPLAHEAKKKLIYNFYLRHTTRINNWDLVDLTAPNIIGEYLLNRTRAALVALARSSSLWERRIAIVATHTFIKHGDFTSTFRISKILLHDREDLIHKAVGWMLREVGKRDEKAMLDFLKTNYHNIPRTTLRYAIERLKPRQRKAILVGKFITPFTRSKLTSKRKSIKAFYQLS